MRLDIERQYARFDRDLGRSQQRVIENPTHACSRSTPAFDLTASLDAAVDQITDREPHVRLERPDAGRLEAIPDAGDIGRNLCFDEAGGRAVKRALGDGLRLRCAQRARTFGVCSADEEMRPLAIVAHQERAAALEAPEQLDHGNALPAPARDDAIT